MQTGIQKKQKLVPDETPPKISPPCRNCGRGCSADHVDGSPWVCEKCKNINAAADRAYNDPTK